eukprot:1000378-Alexandrium_andersonii.AAC.1
MAAPANAPPSHLALLGAARAALIGLLAATAVAALLGLCRAVAPRAASLALASTTRRWGWAFRQDVVCCGWGAEKRVGAHLCIQIIGIFLAIKVAKEITIHGPQTM